MRVVLDTSSLIRFFTRDIEEKAQKVKELLDSDHNISIPDVVFPELEYVLSNGYGKNRDDLSSYFDFLVSLSKIKTTQQAKKAVYIFKDSRLDMADCIIAASSFKGKLASFDKKLLTIKNVQPFWK